MKKKLIAICSTAVAMLLCGGIGLGVSANAANSYANYVQVAGNGSGLMLEPTVIAEPASFAEMGAAAGSSVKAASVIVTPDAEMNVTLGGEEKTLTQTFDSYLKAKFIPIVRLEKDTVEPFLGWLKNTYAITDIMAMSKDVSVLETLYADKSVGYLVNTVYDLTDATISADRYGEWDHIGAANKAGCNILLYDGTQANLPVAAKYVEAMAKVCWAYTDGVEETVSAMAAGCYGIVTDTLPEVGEAFGYFKESGFARAQYVAAHRGITSYCNEQSKTAIMATANEGATHIELDLQVTKDKKILICHNSDTGTTSTGNGYFALATSEALRKMTLKDYSKKYEDTFPTLEETIELLLDTDVIFIFELKFDGASSLAVDELEAIETMKSVIDKYPQMKGRWFTITFFSAYAEKMREVCPEIPVGFLGSATSGKFNDTKNTDHPYPNFWGGVNVTRANMDSCLRNILRKFNVSLDEMTYDAGKRTTDATTNNMSAAYLARGYAQNTWTFEDTLHYSIKCNIATTNAAEDCAMIVKEIAAPATLTEAQLSAKKVTLTCTTYNGWQVEKECSIIPVSREGNKVKVLFYLSQDAGDSAHTVFGLYSDLAEVTVA